jgi:solute carrier family 29 (equilibrative nucleoside transporter), member 1/2/3
MDLIVRDDVERFRCSRVYFFVLGIAVVLPWNAFITAVDYFDHLYPDVHVDTTLSFVYMLSNVVATLVDMKVQQYVDRSLRIASGLVGFIFALGSVPIFAALQTYYGFRNNFVFLAAAVFVSGLCCGFFQPAVFGEASRMHYSCVQVCLPIDYSNMVKTTIISCAISSVASLSLAAWLQAVSSGGGASALIVIILRMVAKGSVGTTFTALQLSTFIYFGVAILFCVATLLLYRFGLRRQEAYKHAPIEEDSKSDVKAPVEVCSHSDDISSWIETLHECDRQSIRRVMSRREQI